MAWKEPVNTSTHWPVVCQNFLGITRNDRPFGCPIIYTDTNSQCYLVHGHLNNAWHIIAHSLIGMPLHWSAVSVFRTPSAAIFFLWLIFTGPGGMSPSRPSPRRSATVFVPFQIRMEDGACVSGYFFKGPIGDKLYLAFSVSWFFTTYAVPCACFFLLYGMVAISMQRRKRDFQFASNRYIHC